MTRIRALFGVVLLFASVGCSAGPSEEPVASTESASHSWSYFHWEKTGSEVVLPLGDNVTSAWEEYLRPVSTDWSRSTVLETNIVAGQGGNSCRASPGRIEVCNRKYGFNGWLGLAQVWVSGGHIVRATARVNDSYFNLARYNDRNAKRHVLCQEVGHTLGLDHQDDASCMNDHGGLTDAAYVSPNSHDYEQLELIYAHEHAAAAATALADSSEDLGSLVERRAHESVYMRDLGEGAKLISFVYRAE